MTDDDISAEYNAAKDEYELAETVLAIARVRLNKAARDMCEAFDKRCAEAEARAVKKERHSQGIG